MGLFPEEGDLVLSQVQVQPRDRQGRFAPTGRRAPDTPLITESPRKNIDQFVHALHALDEELRSLDLPEPVQIRATGGFALLVRGLREDGYTVDIDTITEDYDEAVRDAINTVARELHLEQDWINNQATGDSVEQTTNMLDAVFIAQDYGLDHIDLQVADVPTLTRAKAIVVDVDAMSGRTRDWDDLLSLLDHQGVSSYSQFCREYPSIDERDYPETHRSLSSWYATGDRGLPELDEFDYDIDFDYDDEFSMAY